jgi:transporter family protein
MALGAIFLFSRVEDGASADPQTSLFSPWMLSALTALLLYGIAGITQKLSTQDISDELSTITYWISCLVVAAPLLVNRELDWSFPASTWALALGAGALMGLALWIGFAAYRGGKASIVTALIALYPALTVALAVPILGDNMDAVKASAIGLALLAGLAMTYEGPATEPAAMPTDG